MLVGWECKRCGEPFELYPSNMRRGAIEDHARRCSSVSETGAVPLVPVYEGDIRSTRLELLLALTTLFEVLETSA